jgi:hypothetical protein
MATAKQKIAERRRANAAAVSNLSALGQGVKSIPRRVVNYIRGSTPSDVARDVGNVASSTFSALKEDPAGFIGDTIFFPFSAYRDFSDTRAAAERLRRQGRNAEAQKLEALASAAAFGIIPIAGRVTGSAIRDAEKAVTRGALSAAGKRATKSMAVKALPAPPPRLALPAPGPGLPPFAVKPRGGQWWADKGIGAMRPSDVGVKIEKLPDTDTWAVRNDGGRWKLFGNEDEARAYAQSIVEGYNPNRSAENAARRIADDKLRLVADADGPLSQLQAWFNKAAPKYIKNDLGTAEDPMRALAERGGLHVGLSPDEWSDAAKQVLKAETIGDVIGLNDIYTPKGALPGAGYDFRANTLINMPWLQKAPVTDKIYGIADTHMLQDTMGMGHLLDEMKNALDPRSGLPPELLLRPESLERMSLPAAAERVGLINQYRAKEMERAALAAQENPVTQVFKDYAEDNPMGLRWVEIAPPKGDGPTNYDVEEELSKALKYEGDTMGHCVGGYCPDVMSGRSRIFSLRDAKGEPHVTIETGRGRLPNDAERIEAVYPEAYDEWIASTERLNRPSLPEWFRQKYPDKFEALPEPSRPEEIIQIKGKQNRSPKDAYLPFVQDFVKSQKWGNVGDLGNTGLVRLPDGRYITEQQAQNALSQLEGDISGLDARYLDRLSGENWSKIAPHFEGFAIGGRVERDRCFCRHPMAAK